MGRKGGTRMLFLRPFFIYPIQNPTNCYKNDHPKKQKTNLFPSVQNKRQNPKSLKPKFYPLKKQCTESIQYVAVIHNLYCRAINCHVTIMMMMVMMMVMVMIVAIIV
jgi:hypothetical protein